MRKSTLLKIAMTLTAMFFISGVFAQINLTVNNANGTPAANAVVYTLNSFTAAETTFGAPATAAGLVTWTPGSNGKYFYLVKNAAGDRWANFSVDYTGVAVNATVYLNDKFNPTLGSYVASRNADKITIGRTMPFWVHPSPVHNPSYSAPTGTFATVANIIANLQSTFTWTKVGNGSLIDDGADDGANDNYVQINTTGALDGDIIALEVVENVDAAYGGCSANPVYFNFEAINPPFARITNATITDYSISGTTVNTVAFGCTPVNDKNVTVAFGNAKEEFPYWMRATYEVYNATIDASNDITLLADVITFPDALKPRGGVNAANAANQTTNPMKFTAAGDMYAAPGMDFTTINDKITVYKISLGTWNGSISRKSDYLALSAATAGNIETGAYQWYNTLQTPATDVSVAYIIVFPAPVTGPIYHIPNSFGNF